MSTDGYMWYTYTMEDDSVFKKNEPMPFAVRQGKKNLIWYCLHVQSKKKKKVQINWFTK